MACDGGTAGAGDGLSYSIEWRSYGEDVLAGRVVAGRWIRLAVERQVRDEREGRARGLVFSEAHAQHALQFFGFLRHSKDKWAGQAFELSPWQRYWLAVAFGWYRIDEEGRAVRRFRTWLMKVARKNGKTTLLAAIGLYLLVADGVAGAEIFAAATKLDQAKISHREAQMMVRQSPALAELLALYRNSIMIPGTGSSFIALGADAKTLDGLNVQGALVDELHAHPNRELWDVLESGTGSRESPMMLAITTAGMAATESVCLEKEDYGQKVLQAVLEDDSFLPVLYDIDQGDDPFDEAVWAKANPNLGVSARADKLRQAALLARNVPSARDNFLTKHLNVWVRRKGLWLADIEVWRKLSAAKPYDLGELRKMRGQAFGGLDLGSTSDLSSLMVEYRHGGRIQVFGRHYLPEAALSPERPNAHIYSQWQRQGWLVVTPGDVTDYGFIKTDLLQLHAQLGFVEVGFDRWNATQLVSDLIEEGVPMVKFGQGWASMNAPMRDLERVILSGGLEHNGDPVVTWAMSNVVAEKDASGNIKPDKGRSADKIDPAVSLIMAHGRAMATAGSSDAFDRALASPVSA